MRFITALFLVACSATLQSACDDPGGQTGGQISQTTDATSGSDGVATTTLPTLPDATTPVDTNRPPSDTNDPTTITTPFDTSTPRDSNTPPQDTNTPPRDTSDVVDPTGGVIGAKCEGDGDCSGGARASCLGLPGGYCTLTGCEAGGCPDGSSCWGLGEDTVCIKDCGGPTDCRTGEGYVCDADSTCWYYEEGPGGTSPVGGPCQADADCKDPGAFCYPEMSNGEPTGFLGGYCMIPDCTANSCPAGSTCLAIFADGGKACVDQCGTGGDTCSAGYACYNPGVCFPGCADGGCPTNYACDAENDQCIPSCTEGSCTGGTVCKADGTCGPPPCTANSCGVGYLCAASGECVPDLDGGPGPGPGPNCPDVPARDCTNNCLAITAFEPDEGPGYWDYPINGETTQNEYRSFANGHLQALIKWASAMTACKTADWAGGNGKPIGLGDMSEADGSIPGTSIGEPGHPAGTHEDGVDMDIGYFQVTSPDNKLRPICPNANNHCTGAPNNLDLWRQAFILGLVMQSPRTRVIGVDGKVGPLVEQAIEVLCGQGWLSGTPCSQSKLAYEVTDEGLGWYYFHLHHWHVSTFGGASGAPSLPGAVTCLRGVCQEIGSAEPMCVHGDGPVIAHRLVERLVPAGRPVKVQRLP